MLTSLKSKLYISLASAILIALAFGAGQVGLPSVKSTLFIIVTVLAGMPTVYSAWRALTVRAFSIDLLVSIAVIGALIIGEYEESAIVSFLFIFGSYLEARTLDRTRKSLRDLIDMAPQEAEVMREGEPVNVPVDDVVKGDVVILRTGSQVPVDGTVIHGSGSINEAAVTGEPLAVMKDRDDVVWSGTIVESGYLEMSAERVGEDTTFNQIIELVEEAQDSKAPTQKFLDKFAKFYTPGIIVAAVVAWVVTRDVRFALTLLVIACPGALVISTPVSLVAGLGNASRHGALLKGGDALERFAKVDTLVMDKTGTITEGKPKITEIVAVGAHPVSEILQLAGTLEQASEHPLGRTIVAAAKDRGIVLGASPSNVDVRKGLGIVGDVAGIRVAVGSARLIANADRELSGRARELEASGNTVSFVLFDDDVAGLIAIADQVRADVAGAIEGLRRNGISTFVMLTGDNAVTAQAVADQVGIDQVAAELMPEDKVTKVKELIAAGHKVAMIGDGVNDAPAIATANLGIAMGGGTDVSVEAADVILVGNRFDQLLHARALTRATFANMIQNTVIALITVAVLIAGVVIQVVDMSIGMFVHEISVLLVILNAMRLIRFKNTDAAEIARLRELRSVSHERSGVLVR